MNRLLPFFVSFLVIAGSGCTDLTVEDLNATRRALQTKNPDVCLEISSEYSRDVCLMTVASSKRDASICLRVTSNQSKDSCHLSLAYSTQNPQLCERLGRIQDRVECKESVGRLAEDMTKAFAET